MKSLAVTRFFGVDTGIYFMPAFVTGHKVERHSLWSRMKTEVLNGLIGIRGPFVGRSVVAALFGLAA